MNPCIARNPCASTAICEANNHKTLCHCPTGLLGDPFVNCYEGKIYKTYKNVNPDKSVQLNSNNHT